MLGTWLGNMLGTWLGNGHSHEKKRNNLDTAVGTAGTTGVDGVDGGPLPLG